MKLNTLTTATTTAALAVIHIASIKKSDRNPQWLLAIARWQIFWGRNQKGSNLCRSHNKDQQRTLLIIHMWMLWVAMRQWCIVLIINQTNKRIRFPIQDVVSCFSHCTANVTGRLYVESRAPLQIPLLHNDDNSCWWTSEGSY